MTEITALPPAERDAALGELAHWTYRDDAIVRTIILRDFPEAFALMTRIALEAEKADHHPEWLNVYNRIEIRLTTHDADGVSARDIVLARIIDAFAAQAGAA